MKRLGIPIRMQSIISKATRFYILTVKGEITSSITPPRSSNALELSFANISKRRPKKAYARDFKATSSRVWIISKAIAPTLHISST